MTTMVFLGPPGAGKGTMAKRLAGHAGLVHVSTGELFREAISRGTDLGLKVKAIIDRGDLVPDDLTVELVLERTGRGDCRDGFILDGFPRTIPQADALARIARISAVINFALNDELVIERLSGRRVCTKCGKNYHIRTLPPKLADACDDCGGALYIRKDDQLDSIKNRIQVYKAQTAPLIDYYSAKKLLKDVDAAGDVEQVFALLKKAAGVDRPPRKG